MSPEIDSRLRGNDAEEKADILIRDDATYFITGGLAGLGLLTAEWLVGRGVKHLLLMARSEPNEIALEKIAAWQARGVQVEIPQGDVSKPEDVTRAFETIDEKMPPLKGVFHSAGVLDDGAILQQSWARFESVLAPKVRGGWLLHEHTKNLDLDYFVLYSSFGSLMGNRGQANHAGANMFLDMLAYHRRALGLPGLSINWGAWSQIGAAADRGVDARVSGQGVKAISPENGLRALEYAMRQPSPQIGVLPMDWAAYFRQNPDAKDRLFLEEFRPAEAEKKPASKKREAKIQEQLQHATAEKSQELLLDYVHDQARKIMGLGSRQGIDVEQPLHDLGLDSLMAVELRNAIGSGLSLEGALPATLLFDYPTIAAVAGFLFDEVLHLNENGAIESDPPPTGGHDDLDELTDEQAEALLLQELGEK